VLVTYLTSQTNQDTIATFEAVVYGKESKFKNFGFKIAAFVLGIIATYSFLFATGYFIYGELLKAVLLSFTALFCSAILIKFWKKIV
jgi:hypothetical protein